MYRLILNLLMYRQFSAKRCHQKEANRKKEWGKEMPEPKCPKKTKRGGMLEGGC